MRRERRERLKSGLPHACLGPETGAWTFVGMTQNTARVRVPPSLYICIDLGHEQLVYGISLR